MRRQSAVFVTVAADELVAGFRARYQSRAVARLLPPHITVLPPFWRDVEEDEGLGDALARHFSAFEPFEAALTQVGRFARHVWLAPEPQDMFVALLTKTRAQFPDLVRDSEREPVPHLTIGEKGKAESIRSIEQLAEQEVAPRLPFSFTVRDVGLFEVRPDGWHELRRFELG